MGGRQPGLGLAASAAAAAMAAMEAAPVTRTPRPIAVPEDRAAAHDAFLRAKVKDALWLRQG
jgi:DNA polymerase-3 subunit epsilon